MPNDEVVPIEEIWVAVFTFGDNIAEVVFTARDMETGDARATFETYEGAVPNLIELCDGLVEQLKSQSGGDASYRLLHGTLSEVDKESFQGAESLVWSKSFSSVH